MGRPRVRPFRTPPPLFPIRGKVRGPLDLIPVVPDPTGRGARAWSILSRLPITEGEHAGRLIGENCPPWQERLTRLIFGHVDAEGLRLIREVFACIGKKNGKTSYAAALALTKLLLNEDRREQVVCLAATRLQARIAFDSMAAMIRADDGLGERFEIVEHRHVIKYAATNSVATAVSAELASMTGFNPIACPWSTSCTFSAPRRKAASW
jgi:phage terminase large subunit-like protein